MENGKWTRDGTTHENSILSKFLFAIPLQNYVLFRTSAKMFVKKDCKNMYLCSFKLTFMQNVRRMLENLYFIRRFFQAFFRCF